MQRALKCIMAICLFFAGLILISFNQNLAGLVEGFFPGSTFWVHTGLLTVEALAFLLFWRALFGRRHHLVFKKELADHEKAAFAKELARRMRKNGNLPHEELDPSADDYLEKCLAHLKDKADREIKVTAERIFLATALSQNGRIDAIIVFVSLCRLVWRISSIYNQRPNPGEVLSLYWAVVTATFLAFSLEALDLSTEITVGFGESLHAVAPAAVSGGVPFVGTALKKFTSSAIDGSANAYLALRAGLITRNAYMYALEGQPERVAVYREAGSILLSMANRVVDKIAKTIGEKLWGITKAAPGKTAQAVAGGVTRISDGVTNSAEKIASDAAEMMHSAGNTILSKSKSIFSPGKPSPEQSGAFRGRAD